MTAIDIQSFKQLSTTDIYQIIQLRTSCFIVEQKMCYQDLDNIDLQASHFSFRTNNKLLGYLRFHPINENNNIIKLSRICVEPSHRNERVGTKLIYAGIKSAKKQCAQQIIITAQQYLQEYYQNFGFTVTSKPYIINDISHQDMQLNFNHEMSK